jgi:hypothetical protein
MHIQMMKVFGFIKNHLHILNDGTQLQNQEKQTGLHLQQNGNEKVVINSNLEKIGNSKKLKK